MLMSAAIFRHGGSKAFYRPDTDEIQLPSRTAFPTASGYYNVALHELNHWAGHPNRCARDFSGRFRDAAYAAEELVAEMGAAYLCAHCRIDGELRHASYLASWLAMLKADKRAIFTAAAKSQQSADYILHLADPTRSIAQAA
jgi:antirestriction protein ArdC